MADFHDSLDKALEHTAEKGQWAVRAENGLTCYSSEGFARAAIAEGGFTLGRDRSPIVEALFRADPDDAWTRVHPLLGQTLERGVRNLAEDLRRRTTDHIAGSLGVPYYSGPWVTRELEKLLEGGA